MIPVISKKNGEMLARNARERHERHKEDTVADKKNYYRTLEDMFQEHMNDLREDESELDHGWMCGIAAERTIEDISSHVQAIAEKRKWGHIEAVNKAFFEG